MVIMQGDSYRVPIEIMQNDLPVNESFVEEVEVCIGTSVRKTYTAGDVIFSNGSWYFRLSQEESFGMNGDYDVIVRVKYKNQTESDVVGVRAGTLIVSETNSSEVL